MNQRTKTAGVIGLGLTALGGVYYASRDRLDDAGGASTVQDAYPVQDGALLWDERFEQTDHESIRGVDGSSHPIGSYGAVNAAYEVTANYAQLLTRLTRVVEGSLSDAQRDALYAGFQRTGRYPVRSVCDESQQVMVATMVQAAVNFGLSLRMLGYVYDAAGVTPSYRPSVWIRRHVDLKSIKFQGFLNPMALHTGGTWREYWVSSIRTSDWSAIGSQVELRWLRAYRDDLEHIPGIDAFLAEIQGDLTAIDTTMGIVPAALAIALAKAVGIIIIAATGAYCVVTAMHAVFAYLGMNVRYLDTMTEQYEEALECARDPSRSAEERAACADQARELADRIENYKPGWHGLVTAGCVAAIGVGTLYSVKSIRKGAKS